MKVLWKHYRLSPEDLQTYLSDSIRSDDMLQLLGREGSVGMFGTYYRGVASLLHAESSITSWTTQQSVAKTFGPQVLRYTGWLQTVALVLHSEDSAGWLEYVAVTPR